MSFLEETRQLFAYHRKWTSRFAEHDVHNVFEKAVRDLEAEGMTGLPGKRVLDLGCGALFPVALQFAASGATVTAMDVRYVRPDFLPLAIVRAFSHDGVKPAAKLMIRRVFFGSRYYGALEGAAGKQLRAHRSEIAFSTADPAGGEYPLPSGSFDLIASNAVLEHVPDVPKFAREVKRLLVPGGYFYAIIHNFYSLSGGHSPEWAYPDTDPSDNSTCWCSRGVTGYTIPGAPRASASSIRTSPPSSRASPGSFFSLGSGARSAGAGKRTERRRGGPQLCRGNQRPKDTTGTRQAATGRTTSSSPNATIHRSSPGSVASGSWTTRCSRSSVRIFRP